MSAPAFSFRTSGSTENTIYRATKEGGWETVTTTNKDYPVINAGEKLVWIAGLTEPYTYEAENKNRDTGEMEKALISMVRLEIQVIAGPQRGARFLVGVTKGYIREDGSEKPHITPKTNFGKMLSAILKREVPKDYGFEPADIVRKPFFMVTENEVGATYTKTKFVSARPHIEEIDGPIPGAASAPPAKAPEPVPVAVAADPGDALFDEDL